VIVIPNQEKIVMVDKMTAVGGPLAGAKCDLYQNDYIPSSISLASSFVVCDFVGYVQPAPITWTPAFLNALEQAVTTSSAVLVYRPTDATKPQVAFGYYVTDGSGNLVFAERFASSVPLNDIQQSVHLVPTFAFGG